MKKLFVRYSQIENMKEKLKLTIVEKSPQHSLIVSSLRVLYILGKDLVQKERAFRSSATTPYDRMRFYICQLFFRVDSIFCNYY